MTIVFAHLIDWQQQRQTMKNQTLGFVPTMGALHQGHLSLIQRAQQENDLTLVSIFVNPTQFNQPGDLAAYPRVYQEDLALLKEHKVDYLLFPDESELYPDHYRYQIHENSFSTLLCGATRPGHFTGVLTIVLKLLNLAKANKAYFGEKDYQQLQLIKGMAQAFFLPTEIIACPTIREQDGLAMSSRNRRLSPHGRQQAPLLAKLLQSNLSIAELKDQLANNGFVIDYIEEQDGRRFAAVFLEGVRLIDNVSL
jgi:pantoate--beta-alanine ligase